MDIDPEPHKYMTKLNKEKYAITFKGMVMCRSWSEWNGKMTKYYQW